MTSNQLLIRDRMGVRLITLIWVVCRYCTGTGYEPDLQQQRFTRGNATIIRATLDPCRKCKGYRGWYRDEVQ